MRKPNLRVTAAADFNITPMIDVVMLLIVFFLLASHLSRQETQTPLELPKADTGLDPIEETNRRRIIVNVLPDGDVLLAGQPVSHEEFARRIQVERQASSRELEVRIRADRQVHYRHVGPLLVACAKNNLWKVSFAVQRKRPSND